MSSLSSVSVHPLRARGADSSHACPICGKDGCAIYPAGGACNRCFGSGKWKSPRSSRELDCLACGGSGVRQARIICRRIASDRATSAANGWIHSPDAETIANIEPPKPSYDLAAIDHRHAVYSALLECQPLNRNHDEHLQNVRGLSEETITAAEFASAPAWRSFDDEVAELATRSDLSGVPGFFQVRDKWCWRGCGEGILIPIRDHQRRIQCLQMRPDRPKDPKAKYMMVSGAPDKLPHSGTRSGCPNHFIRFDAGAKSVLIVEGILKAEIVAEWSHLVGLNCPIVACVGTGTFGDIGRQLKGLMPGLRVAWTAFDRNQEGKGEEDTRMREKLLHERFQGVGVKADVVEWDDVKGMDDWLLSLREGV